MGNSRTVIVRKAAVKMGPESHVQSSQKGRKDGAERGRASGCRKEEVRDEEVKLQIGVYACVCWPL